MKIKLVFALIFSALFLTFGSQPSLAMDSGKDMPQKMFMVAGFKLMENNAPLSGATVTIGGQTRETDPDGKAEFEDIGEGERTLQIKYQGKSQDVAVQVHSPVTEVSLNGKWDDMKMESTGTTNSMSKQSTMVLTIFVALLCFGLAMVLIKKRSMLVDHKKNNKRKTRRGVIAAFIALGVISTSALGYEMLQTPVSSMGSTLGAATSVDASLPMPSNLKIYPDDRTLTVVWDPVANASGAKIVGYVVRWGEKNGPGYTDMKQTIHTVTQIQPLKNNVEYIVEVRAVHGVIENRATGPDDTYAPRTSAIAVADGRVSKPIYTIGTSNDAKEVAQRSRLTAFYDDFNTAAGAFDEKKWNMATTSCTGPDQLGQFINSQFHAHNQTKAVNCDRDNTASRPRALVDISNGAQAQIEFDFDGVTQPRDVWYLDLIDVNARKNGFPVDITGHNDSTDADREDPGNMIRIAQYQDKMMLHYYDATNAPQQMPLLDTCGNWFNLADQSTLAGCGPAEQAARYNPSFNPNHEIQTRDMVPVPNVRRHWVILLSHAKIIVFIDGVKMMEAATPETFANIDQYQVHSTLFSYNTGKNYSVVWPQTSLVHWDNFGISGNPPALVTHNYLDGSADGTKPMIGLGTSSNLIEPGARALKIPVPDAIGTPVGKARLMFTLQALGSSLYVWNASDNVVVNGKTYSFPNPALNTGTPLTIRYDNNPSLGEKFVAHSTGISVYVADLKDKNSGVMNDIKFNISGIDFINVHLELDYDKANEPAYTQPAQVFEQLSPGISFNSYIVPVMKPNDSYWFIEQNMGLTPDTDIRFPNAQAPTSMPIPTAGATIAPVATSTITPVISPTPSRTPTPALPTATRVPSPTSTAPQATPTIITSTGGGFGYTTKGGLQDTGDSNYINTSKFKMGTAAKRVVSMSAYVGPIDAAPNNMYQLAIYTDNNGTPGALIASSSTGTLRANSWNKVGISANLNANTSYWLAYNSNGSSDRVNNLRYANGGVSAFTQIPYGTWPQTFGGVSTGTAKFSIFASFQ